MTQDPTEPSEWHIVETPTSDSSTISHQAIHMGPFETEEECRAVLAGLIHLPAFTHGNLAVRQEARRRQKRIRIKLPVQISRLASAEGSWAADTVDISSLGARLSDTRESLKLGEFVEIRYGAREAVFRVVWIGSQGTPAAGHVGVECLSPETNIWDLDLSTRTDDGPLFQEIVVARAVQRKLFPRQKPHLRTLDYSGKCIQARTVGGDYYDFLDLGAGHVGFVLADVAGKGVAAALLMANLHGSIHSRAGIAPGDLPGLLSAVNSHLYEHTEPEGYATLFFGCYNDDARTLTYINCGHLPPLLLHKSGDFKRLEATATVLGLLENWECSVGQTVMESGDVLSIFTDGITETTASNGDEFGEARLLSVLQESRNLESAAILKQVEKAVEQFRSGEHLQDDVTLVVARAQ